MSDKFVFEDKKQGETIIAIPTDNGQTASSHFGHAATFTFFKVNKANKTVIDVKAVIPPEHQPGVIPVWVAKMGADVIMSGGMGQMAVKIFENNGIKVIVGVGGQNTKQLIEDYLNDTLTITNNSCSH